jgi:hypothetical protein
MVPQASRLVKSLITLVVETTHVPAQVREETCGWAALMANTCVEHQRITLTIAAYCSLYSRCF